MIHRLEMQCGTHYMNFGESAIICQYRYTDNTADNSASCGTLRLVGVRRLFSGAIAVIAVHDLKFTIRQFR